MKREALLALAAGFRESNPKLAEHGFVTIYKGTVTGWKRTLNRPGTEVPGAYAVGADASIFRACGGDEEHGAHAFLLATGACTRTMKAQNARKHAANARSIARMIVEHQFKPTALTMQAAARHTSNQVLRESDGGRA